MTHYFWLIPVGFIIGSYGTLIGSGGGFLLVPVLLLLYPDESPVIITSISLVVVFFNALSGSWAYARMKRIDYQSGLLFAICTIPGAIIGALSTSFISRRLFDVVFGLLLMTASIFLLLHPNRMKDTSKYKSEKYLSRKVVEKDGTVHTFSYNPFVGVGVSFFTGYLSSFLGIGGGIIHVPALVHLLHFPVHIATATSHFILVIMAMTGTLVRVLTGSFSHGIHLTIALAIGVLLGAQLGALLSNRVQGGWIIRCLAMALGFLGIRILLTIL